MNTKNKIYSTKINKELEKLPDYITEFVYNHGKMNNYATKYEYSRDIYHFFEYIFHLPLFKEYRDISDIVLSDLDKIDGTIINEYLNKLSLQGNKPRTLQRKRASISSMYTYFIDIGKLKNNPVAASQKIQLEKEEFIYLTEKEQEILLYCVRTGEGLSHRKAGHHGLYVDRDSAIILLLLDSGLRISELASTEIIDYDFDKCCVEVMRKIGEYQTVFFSDECASYLQTYFDKQIDKYQLTDTHFPAFTNNYGDRLTIRSIERMVKKYAEVAVPGKAKKITPAKLRSSFAMSFYNASDHDIVKLQHILNHANLATTNIYARAADTDSEKTRNILQNARAGKK